MDSSTLRPAAARGLSRFQRMVQQPAASAAPRAANPCSTSGRAPAPQGGGRGGPAASQRQRQRRVRPVVLARVASRELQSETERFVAALAEESAGEEPGEAVVTTQLQEELAHLKEQVRRHVARSRPSCVCQARFLLMHAHAVHAA